MDTKIDINKVFEFLSGLNPVHAAIASYLLFTNEESKEVVLLARLSPVSRPDWIRAIAGISDIDDPHNRSIVFAEAKFELAYALKENST